MSLDGVATLMLRRGPSVHIPTSGNEQQLQHVRGRGFVEPARPRRHSPLPRSRLSSHACVGDMSTVKPRASRVCVLRRVCLDTASGEFFYYRDGNATLAPIVYDQRYGHIFAFGHVAPRGGREDLLPLNKHVRYKRHARWSPRMVDGPMPRAAPLLLPPHLLSAPFVPTNLGHLVWEEAFPLLLAMAQLGVYEESAVVLRTHRCNESVGSAEPVAPTAARLCRKFGDGFLRPLQGGRGGSSSAPLQSIAELRARHAGSRHVCFARLIAGGYFDIFNEVAHPGKEPLLALYRHRVLAYHGLVPRAAPQPAPTSHTLLLVRKQGRRGIANFDQVLRFVRGGCDGGCVGISRDRVVPAAFHTMTVREQLRLVSTATLAISPPGGVSMILPFMPEGSHVILINYMLARTEDGDEARGTERHGPAEGRCRGCSLTMEASLWRHVRHVHKLLYQVWEPSDFARGKPARDAAVLIKLPRLSYLLRVALDAMAGDDGLGDDATP